jgi:hypothetical protein
MCQLVYGNPACTQSITHVVYLIPSQTNTSAEATFFPLPSPLHTTTPQFTYTHNKVDTKRMTLHTTRSGNSNTDIRHHLCHRASSRCSGVGRQSKALISMAIFISEVVRFMITVHIFPATNF